MHLRVVSSGLHCRLFRKTRLQPRLLRIILSHVIHVTGGCPESCKSDGAIRKCVVQEQDGTTAKSVLLKTEPQNLTYVLAHSELTEEERSLLKDRLATVEDEFLQMYTANLPN
jgi:hypothetical protein